MARRQPVACVHGNSDCLRIDEPFLDAAGQRLENLARVETFGNNAANGTNDVQWLEVVVGACSRQVPSQRPMVVPGNRAAVPAPEAGAPRARREAQRPF